MAYVFFLAAVCAGVNAGVYLFTGRLDWGILWVCMCVVLVLLAVEWHTHHGPKNPPPHG